MKLFKLSLLTIFLTLTAVTARCEENTILFKDAAFPIIINVAADTAIGTVVYETQFSEAPDKDYDTVLINGEMPDPRMQLQIRVKNGAAVKIFDRSVIHRFPNGRFWAKYSIGPVTREPLKVTLINDGAASAHTFTIYGVEAFHETTMRESPEGAAIEIYKPDPGFYLPREVPFTVFRRDIWKAAPPKASYTPHTPKMFTLHHTQGNSPKNFDAAVQEMQFIQDYHQNGRGWIDIAYHFLISPQGDIFEGRPINVVGAHVLNWNTANVGVSIMGNYHPPVNQIPTKETLNSFVEMGKYLKSTYNISVSSFYAHRDIGSTDCPGDILYARVPELRDLIFKAETPVPVPPTPITPPSPPATPADSSSLNQLLEYTDK